MGRVVRVGIGLVIVVGFLATLGEKSVFDLGVGDCFDDPDQTATEVERVESKECVDPHDNEVYALVSMTGSGWPGPDEVNEFAARACYERFTPYVNRSYEESQLEIGWMAPTRESWEERDDRLITCYLYDMELSKLTGSMRNSGV